jgi:hypothetical protein
MSIFKNLLGAFVPVRERRESAATLGSVNAELVHDLNGDESALVYLNAAAGTWNATVDFSGSVDGVNFFSVPAYPFSPGCTSATAVPVAAQPLLTEVINSTSVVRVYALQTGQLKKLRVRLPAWTAGNADVTVISEAQASVHPNVVLQKSGTLFVTATGAAGAAVTATLPAVAGLRHYIDFVQVRRIATAALTAAATPVVVTTTNLPGSPALSFGADAAGIGLDKDGALDFGGSGLAAVLAGTATTVVCPVYVGVIWRVNVAYRLGL